jgi:hypothetical protein
MLGFSRYSPGRLRDFALGTYQGMEKNEALFANPPVPLDKLLAQIERVSACISAAMDGGKTAFAERNKQLEELRKMLVQNDHYVENQAPDRATFLLSGYQLDSQIRTQTTPLSNAIRNLDWGENSGSFRFRFIAVKAADSYELRWAPRLPDGTPGQWKTKPFAKTKAYITIAGFTPGTTYIFQVRALIHIEFTDWSDPISKIAQ